MKILLVTTEIVTEGSPSGGLANSVVRLAAGLKQFNHQTLVLGPGTEVRSEETSPGLSASFQVRTSAMVKRADALLLWRFNLAITAITRAKTVSRKIADLTRTFQPDLIVYPNLGAVALFRPAQIPSIIRISSDTQSCRNLGGYDNQSPFAMFQQITLENAALRRADARYAPSSRTAASVARKLKRPVDVLRTPFFLETPDEDDSILRERLSGRTYLIFVGLLNRLKGVPVIAEMLPGLLLRHPDLNFVFVGREHAGFAGNTMQDHVLGLATDVRDRVHFLGELSHKQLYPLIRGTEAVVLPSLIDNLPNTCLEAMALGKVVVGTGGTSFEELLDDGVSGVLCRAGDPESLEFAIEQVLAFSEAEVRLMGQRALETARQFDPEQTIPPLVEYFENVRRNHSHPTTQSRS